MSLVMDIFFPSTELLINDFIMLLLDMLAIQISYRFTAKRWMWQKAKEKTHADATPDALHLVITWEDVRRMMSKVVDLKDDIDQDRRK